MSSNDNFSLSEWFDDCQREEERIFAFKLLRWEWAQRRLEARIQQFC